MMTPKSFMIAYREQMVPIKMPETLPQISSTREIIIAYLTIHFHFYESVIRINSEQ